MEQTTYVRAGNKIFPVAPMDQSSSFKISEALDKFWAWSRFQRNICEISINWYRKILERFITNMGDLEISGITRETIWQWRKRLEEEGLSAHTLRYYLSAVRVFLRFCKEMSWIQINIEEIKIPSRPPKREVIYFTNEEVNKITEKISNLTFRTIFEVLLSTGLRRKEICSLNREDIKGNEIKVIGKRDKERTVFLNPRALEWLERYLKTRTDDKPALFLTRTGTKMTPDALSGNFRNFRKKINITKKFSSHICRHTFATNMIMNGAGIYFVKDLLGHSDIKTTDHYYLGVDKEKIKEVHSNFLNYGETKTKEDIKEIPATLPNNTPVPKSNTLEKLLELSPDKLSTLLELVQALK